MARFDLFSKRRADISKAGQSDVYRYDFVTTAFRVQLLNIANKAFGEDRYYRQAKGHMSNSSWVWVDETFAHEKGINPLGGKQHMPEQIREAFMRIGHEDALDLVEIIAFKIKEYDDEEARVRGLRGINVEVVTRIDEINYRLREAAMGYQFEGSNLTRVDSQLVHQEVVKPALILLSRPGYEGVQEEFLQAHDHYRQGKNKEAVALAASALESTFKAIFTIKQWEYKPNPRISDLVKVAREKKLWPDYLDNSFDQLTATLQSGLPQIRDKAAVHGQGPIPKEVSSYLAAYALHLAATNIVFLVSAADGPS